MSKFKIRCGLVFLFSAAVLVSFFFFKSPTFCDFNASCTPSSYLAVYINGINTLKSDAKYSAANYLFPAIGSTYNGEGVTVVVAYNKSRGGIWVLADLVDVFRQKLTEYPGVGSDLIFKALTSGVFGSEIPDSLQNFITQYHINKIKDYGYTGYDDADLSDILGDIRSKMVENQKIILIPHSQGNLYANAAYEKLTSGDNAVPKEAIKIMGIASPAAYVAGGGDYLTSTHDLIIGALRSSGLSVLSSNFPISITTKDLAGHSLSDVYLNPDLEGRAELINRIHASMSSLSLPGGQGLQGPITVTLTWGAQPDVDLHVYEPDGTHVFYSNKQGHVGSLDVDDVTSYGPEHYYTSCASLATGTYTIGVNYFYGNGPEVAIITISTPFSSVTRSVNLTTVMGSGGNNSPIIIGTINVTMDVNGKYRYEIL